VLPRRWVVELTFAWLGRNRRLSKDYEALPCTEEAWIYLAMIRLLLARLTLRGLFRHPLSSRLEQTPANIGAGEGSNACANSGTNSAKQDGVPAYRAAVPGRLIDRGADRQASMPGFGRYFVTSASAVQ
jgi:Transposase DDE domain